MFIRNRQLRSHVAAFLGEYSAARMSYDLRRLCLKGLMYRKAGSTRYLTPYSLKDSLFLARSTPAYCAQASPPWNPKVPPPYLTPCVPPCTASM